MATIFAPTRIEGTPKATAMLEAEFTVSWADMTTTVKLASARVLGVVFFCCAVQAEHFCVCFSD